MHRICDQPHYLPLETLQWVHIPSERQSQNSAQKTELRSHRRFLEGERISRGLDSCGLIYSPQYEVCFLHQHNIFDRAGNPF